MRWPRWLCRRYAQQLSPTHEASLREAERRLREIHAQRGRVADLEAILAARRKANRFSAAVQEALASDRHDDRHGGERWK